MNILFVCTGNSCRSIIAEALLKDMLKNEGGRNISVDSAGVAAANGNQPAENTQKVLAEYGIEITGKHSKSINQTLTDWADLIITMSNYQREIIIEQFDNTKEKTYLLTNYISGEVKDINDPIGMGLDYYRTTVQELKGYMADLLEKIS